MARRRAAITKDEFGQLFKELFDRAYDDRRPLSFLTAEEHEPVMAYVVAGCVLDQFTYTDPVTNLTYEVFYDFDYDAWLAGGGLRVAGGEESPVNPRPQTTDGAGSLCQVVGRGARG